VRTDLHPCYILHRRPYREHSLLIEVLSRRHGRWGLVARGVRRRSRRPAIPLQPFQLLLLSWQGRGELGTLTRHESAAPPLALPVENYFAALYLNELLLSLLHRYEPHHRLFASYHDTLLSLQGGGDQEAPLRSFEVCLLRELGYGPALEREHPSGEYICAEAQYYYQVGLGPCRNRPAGDYQQISGRALQFLSGEGPATPTSLREAKRLLRHILAQQLNGRPLASRALYREYLGLSHLASEQASSSA